MSKSSPFALKSKKNVTLEIEYRYNRLDKMELHDAAENGNLQRVILLVEQGPDKEKRNDFGLYLASSHGHIRVVKYLVEQRARLDKANKNNLSPLAIAAFYGHLEVASYLLEQGADRDKADNHGLTPLHWAAQIGHLEIVMLLMSYGADLNMKDCAGQLPIEITRFEAIQEAIRDEPRRLMDHGQKRATEQDRHPNATTSPSFPQTVEECEEMEDEQSKKRPRLDKVSVAEEENKIAEEDEDSEPSSDEEYDN